MRKLDLARTSYERALEIAKEVLGAEHADVAWYLDNLAGCLLKLKQTDEAESLYQQALAIREKALGPEHIDVAVSLSGLAGLYRLQGRYAEALPLLERGLAVREEVIGTEHPIVASSLNELAGLYFEQDRPDDAEPLVDRAIAIYDRTHASPSDRFDAHYLRARICWNLNRPHEAVKDLQRAMDLAEQQPGQSGGAEQEPAQHFSRFAEAFERMVGWQVELGDTAEALAAIERGRACSLLDDMNLGGAELQIGRPAAEREQLHKREAELKAKIAELWSKPPTTPRPTTRIGKSCKPNCPIAREQLYDHFRQDRSTSPVYRNLLSVSAGPPRLSQIQRRLVGDDGLLLIYLVGEEGSYVLAVGPHDSSLTALVADEAAAKKLAIEPGPLTSAKLRAVCANERHDGVVERLADSQGAKAATANLAVLWKLLVPEAERKALAEGKVKRLIVVPDGPLALLPFEALVVEPGENPRYLLDVGPPIVYAPSATVLYNLSDRKTPAKAKADRSPVLTVGNPTYRAAKAPQVASNYGRHAGAIGGTQPLRVGGRNAGSAPVFGHRIDLGGRGLQEARHRIGRSDRADGHRGQLAQQRRGPPRDPPGVPRAGRPAIRQLLRRLGIDARQAGQHRPGRRRLFDAAGDLRAEPEGLRVGDFECLRNELRPATDGAKGYGPCRAGSWWPARDASWPATGWSTTRPPPA